VVRLLHVADWLLERVVPKAVASACVPADPWRDIDCSGTGLCCEYRVCHYSCYGAVVCTGWQPYC
jgi:hypothetical protein